MIKINFSSDDSRRLQKLADKHKHPFVRKKAFVLLLKSKNIPHAKIAQIANICENTVRSYLKGYQSDALEFVLAINFYQPQSELKPYEVKIKEYLDKTPPASVKQACAEIKKLTGVKLEKTQMRYHIKRLGAGYRKVCGIPAKADVEKQRIFKEESLDPRLKEAKSETRTVFFMDAAHFVLGAFLSYLWCLSRVFVKTPSGRQRFNVLGALNAISKELLTVTNDTYITSIQVCELLELIKKKTKGPITIILDNAKYQRCKLVMELALKLDIELLFLPPYSPNLNLIERLWKFIKKQCLNSVYHPDFDAFRSSISNFISHMHKTHKDELSTLLTPKFQTFKQEQFTRPNALQS